jgi:hypothetical protein
MHFSVETSKLFGLVAHVLEAEFSNPLEASDGIGTELEIEMAHEQVCLLRNQVHQYDSNHRANELKPCINHRVIVDRVVEAFRDRLQVAYVHRVCGYKTLFIMYLICRLIPPIKRSWWERRFMEELPAYLERTDFFKGANCKHRLDVILDQLPQDGVLPMEVERVVPASRPKYPMLYPVNVYNGCLFVDMSRNEKCQQFYGQITDSQFQKTV